MNEIENTSQTLEEFFDNLLFDQEPSYDHPYFLGIKDHILNPHCAMKIVDQYQVNGIIAQYGNQKIYKVEDHFDKLWDRTVTIVYIFPFDHTDTKKDHEIDPETVAKAEERSDRVELAKQKLENQNSTKKDIKPISKEHKEKKSEEENTKKEDYKNCPMYKPYPNKFGVMIYRSDEIQVKKKQNIKLINPVPPIDYDIMSPAQMHTFLKYENTILGEKQFEKALKRIAHDCFHSNVTKKNSEACIAILKKTLEKYIKKSVKISFCPLDDNLSNPNYIPLPPCYLVESEERWKSRKEYDRTGKEKINQ